MREKALPVIDALNNLQSDSLDVRRKAVKTILLAGAAEYSNEKAELLGTKATIDKLLTATDDEDPKIIEYATGALWAISLPGRYSSDKRICAKLLKILESKNKTTKRHAASGLENFVNDEKAEPLLKALDNENNIMVVEAILNNFYKTISKSKQKEIIPKLKEILDTTKKENIKKEIADAIKWLKKNI